MPAPDPSTLFPSGEALQSLAQVKDSLRPATYGCPECGTTRVIASPAPPGNCPDCGRPYEIRS